MGEYSHETRVAEEFPFSLMTPEEKRSMLLPEPRVRTEIPEYKLTFSVPALPPTFDWRNVNGVNYVTPVKSQYGGTCIAYAWTAAVESLMLRTVMWQGTEADLSEHALVSCNSGYPASIPPFLLSIGLPPEACYPSDLSSWETATPCTEWQQMTFKIVNHDYFEHLTLDEVRTLIVYCGPIVTGMNVPFDFFGCGPTSGIYSYNGDAIAGFHEVLIVGYDHPNQYFIAKNSWGQAWGEGGFFRIAYSEFNSSPVGFGGGVDVLSGIVGPTAAIVYQHNNYRGHFQVLQLGCYDFGQITIGNDVISSVRVPPGWRVTLYQHAGFQGSTTVLTADTPSLPAFNDMTSSIIVEDLYKTVPCVCKLPRSVASKLVRAVGLVPKFTGSTSKDAWVFSQSPQCGKRVRSGSTVTMVCRTGPIP